MRRLVLLALLVFLAIGCDRGPSGSGEPVRASTSPSTSPSSSSPGTSPAPTRVGREAPAAAGGLTWDAPAPLVSRPPENAMRAAEYEVRDHVEARLAVFHFGGGQGGDVQSNLDRWLGQLEQPDGRPTSEVARIERRVVNDMPVTTVDATGTFIGRLGMDQDAPSRPRWRVLGAIAEGPEGFVFFKLTGPAAGVDLAADAFEQLVESIRPR